MEIRFDRRTAIVTGAGRGIGKAYALELAKRGANVLVNDSGAALDGSGRDASIAESVAAEILAAGGRAASCSESVADMNGGKRIVEAAMDTFGRVDILIANAGILRDRSFLKMTETEWDEVIAVHLKGTFTVTKPAFSQMKTDRFGRIVFTSSTSGLFGNFGQTNYSAAKMGVVGLMNSLKIEAAKLNIKINTIAPGGATRMTESVFTGDMKTKMDPSYNVPLAIYLASEQNCETGMIFCAKGGWYARAAVVCSGGVAFNRDAPVTAESICDRFKEIIDLTDATPLENGAETRQFIAP